MRDRLGNMKPLVVKDTEGKTYNIDEDPEADDFTDLEVAVVKNTRIRVKMSCVGRWVAGSYMCRRRLHT